MNARVALVAAGLAVALSGTGTLSQTVDVNAQREQLLNRLDELQKQAQPRGQGGAYAVPGAGEGARTWVAPGGNGQRSTTVDVQRYTEVYREMAEVRKQIVRLDLGPELAVRYDEYLRRQTEQNDQYRALWSDKELDNETRQARAAEIRKAQMGLSTEFADVLKKSAEAEQRINLRRMQRSQLDYLKDLLNPTDAEWQVLEPRLREILRLQDELRVARGYPQFWSAGARRWQNPPTNTTEGQLMGLVKKDDAEPKTIQEKLDALRKERAAKQKRIDDLTAALKTAQEDLRKLLIVRQESILVIEGVLD